MIISATLRSAILLLFMLRIVVAEPLVLKSDSRSTELIELYTSQGCSSCPPAERWISALVDDDRLWRDFVPVAFHVDYWDRLGWPDTFADTAYSRRQRESAQSGHANSVYTPQFLIAGREWRGFFSKRSPVFPGKDAGVLAANLDGADFSIRYSPTSPEPRYFLHIATLGMNRSVSIRRGENAGRSITHDFVVLDMLRRDGRSPEWSGRLPANMDIATADAIAVWVTGADPYQPLQAVGGYLRHQRVH